MKAFIRGRSIAHCPFPTPIPRPLCLVIAREYLKIRKKWLRMFCFLPLVLLSLPFVGLQESFDSCPCGLLIFHRSDRCRPRTKRLAGGRMVAFKVGDGGKLTEIFDHAQC